MIIGRIRAISTSKIKKIIAIKKKCRENGSRDEDLGSNPHSNGEHFSRSVTDFLEIIIARKIIIKHRLIIIVEIFNNEKIIYTIEIGLLIGSQIYLYTI